MAHARSEDEAVGRGPPGQLLATKLFVPRSRQRRVERSRLDALLDRDVPLTLVSAPAGFGKSTAVSDWLSRQDVRVSWLSLDASDDEPRRFLRYLLAAWRRLIPDFGTVLESMSGSSGLPVADAQAAFVGEVGALAETERASDGQLVLVLDDYHAIGDTTSHRLVESLIEVLPLAVRLVLITRVDPPFALARMRARGRLEEIRAADLRFRATETVSFLGDAMEIDLPDEDAEALCDRTEGWAVGLQLAALSLRGRVGSSDVRGAGESGAVVGEFLRDFDGSHRFVLDYLTDEVLGRQDEPSLEFLVRVAALDEVCGPLADAVTGRDDGRAKLEALEAENLFLLPLDDRREWYRFHHLFAECLRRDGRDRLGPQAWQAVHRRACDWLLEAGRPDAALGHALEADDSDRARRILHAHADLQIHQGDVEAVSRWLDRVPPQWIADDPLLAITRALVRFMLLDWTGLGEMESRLSELLTSPSNSEALEGGEPVKLEGRRAMLRLLVKRASGELDGVVAAGRDALRRLPESDVLLRGTAAVILGGALLRREEWAEGEEALRLGIELHRESHNHMALASGFYNWTRLLIHQGRPRQGLRLAREGAEELSRRTAGRLSPVGGLAAVAEAEALLELGQFGAAWDRAREAVEVSAGSVLVVELSAWIVQVRIARVLRRFDEAVEILRRLDELLLRVGLARWQRQRAYYAARIRSVQAQLGDAAARERWGAWVRDEVCLDEGTPMAEKLLSEAPFEGAVALCCRWTMENGEPARALALLRELRTEVEDGGWVRSILVTWILEARALELLGEDPSEALGRALELSADSGFLQVFADEREWLGPLLGSLPARSDLLGTLDPDSREELLAILDPASYLQTHPGASARPVIPDQGLPEPLSAREIEVLASVAEGRTNAQVGEHLFISPATVKTHLENIYGKLAVGGRLEAVNRARALGLLEAPGSAASPA